MHNNKPATKPQQVDIDRIIKRETTKLFVGGSLFIISGAISIAVALAEAYTLLDPILLSRMIWFGFMICFLALVIVSGRSITRALMRTSQDEYQYRLNIEARSQAYTVLNYGVLFAIMMIAGTGRGAMGFLAIVLGISWIITARGGGRVDV